MDDASSTTDLPASRARLHQAVELVEGMDGATLLYDSRTKQYTRIGATAAQILTLMSEMPEDSTVQDVMEALADQNRTTADVVWEKAGPLFKDLDARGSLVDSAEPDTKTRVTEGFQLVRRHPMIENPARILGPLAGIFTGIPSPLVVGLTAIGVSAAVVSLSLTLPELIAAGVDQTAFVAAAVALIFTTFLHEGAHTALLVRYGTPPREAGVGLLFGFLPIAYVDRSDSYRIVERRRRVFVSLAGPLTDLVLAGAAAFAAQFVTGSDQDLLYNLAVLLTIVFFINLNPILPTDGAHALEAATGQINVHAKAFEFVFGRFTPKQRTRMRPPVSGRMKVLYVCVVCLTAVWLVMIVTMLVLTVVGLGRGA